MNRERVRILLGEVAAGTRTPESALDALAVAPLEHLAFATIDHHRAIRQGVPEVVFAPGKTVEEIVALAERLVHHHGSFLATRVSEEQAVALCARLPDAVHNARAHTVRRAASDAPAPVAGPLLIATAGTSDLPVAEECAETAMASGI